jgi:hypothetical protein
MGEQNYSIDQDLREAQAMVETLVPYVYEDNLYARLGGMGIFSTSNMPSLTLGAVLLRLRRLRALEPHLSREQRQTLRLLEKRHREVRAEWRHHYDKKLVQEALSRLKMINVYCTECQENPRGCAGAYMPEALRRTIVQEIVTAMNDYGVHSAEVDSLLPQTDSQLRRYVYPVPFIWSPVLEPVYPQDPFWWLYARPQ